MIRKWQWLFAGFLLIAAGAQSAVDNDALDAAMRTQGERGPLIVLGRFAQAVNATTLTTTRKYDMLTRAVSAITSATDFRVALAALDKPAERQILRAVARQLVTEFYAARRAEMLRDENALTSDVIGAK